jgi:hypothetical protein
MKTNELTGAALNWAVALCEGWAGTTASDKIGSYPWLIKGERNMHPKSFRPSTNWMQGGPIIESERIGIRDAGGDGWAADDYIHATMYGETPLIAAMRCYVASKLGDEVEIPDAVTNPLR